LISQHATFLHGFTQTGASWSPVLDLLSTLLVPSCPDAPGHGNNPDGQRSLTQYAEDVASTMQTGVLVGYSMGARMALHVALAHPQKVTALVLISGTPGLLTETERAARRDSDNELADHLELVGTETFIDEWLALPMFSGLNNTTNGRSERLANTANGLADSLRYAGTGTQLSLWNDITQLQIPVHLITGQHDEKFTDIARQMNDIIPSSTLNIVPDVGHTVHLENPITTARLIDELFHNSE
jgi:2-succinyl-6-hydroxy-2,4-cyclohexadiene-1-carboxylate synthase